MGKVVFVLFIIIVIVLLFLNFNFNNKVKTIDNVLTNYIYSEKSWKNDKNKSIKWKTS